MFLLMDDDDDAKRKHFNYDKIVEQQNLSKKKRKKLLKKGEEPPQDDEFQVRPSVRCRVTYGSVLWVLIQTPPHPREHVLILTKNRNSLITHHHTGLSFCSSWS